MAEGFSSADIAKLERAISEASALLARQEEIVKKVLDAEIDIGNVRIAKLEKFFDVYSDKLDSVVARKASKISDTLLILEKQATESFTAATANLEEAQDKLNAMSNNQGKQNNASVQDTVSADKRGALGTADEAVNEGAASKLEWALDSKKSIADMLADIEKGTTAAIIDQGQIKEAQEKRLKEYQETRGKAALDLENTLIALAASKHQTQEEAAEIAQASRIARIQEAAGAELAAQELLNQAKANADSGSAAETAGLLARKKAAEDTQKSIKQLEEQRIKFITEEELKLKRKNHRALTEEELAALVERADKEFEINAENIQKLNDLRDKEEAESLKAKQKQQVQDASRLIAQATALTGFSADNSVLDRLKTLEKVVDSEEKRGVSRVEGTIDVAVKALASLAQQLEIKIDDIASNKGLVDTRLQGSSREQFMGSYWDQLVRDMTSVGAINPFFKQETFANKIKAMVDAGIAHNLEQRAFLATISDKIATTFNATDSTLLRLIRIQQEDSTAGRLGMESALNAFLNNMYENTEYLKGVAESVRGSLQEMEALMDGVAATEVEYQVQKWMGSLYSVGMSQNAVQGIAGALGQIAAGQIEGLTSNGAGNLLIMAANDAGIPIADILTKGITSEETNTLLQAAVNYLADLAEASGDNKVIQQQLATVFGVKASDLKAAVNLTTKDTVNNIYQNSLTYDSMLGRLNDMAGSMWKRTSIAEMMTNIWANGQYSLAGSMASNPISYFIYKMATVLDDTAGGIAIPAISAMGSGVDLETTVADLMRVAALSTGILGSLEPMVSGLGNSFSGRAMLEELGIKSGVKLSVTPRGTGEGLYRDIGGGTKSTSGSGYVGNASGSDIKNSTLQEAEDSKKKQMIEAQEEASVNQIDTINTTVLKIYELLDDVVHGSGSLRVKVEGYGLTKAGTGGAQGGVSGILNSGSGGNVSYSTSGSGVLTGNGTALNGSVDFGGWTTL